MDLVPYAVPFFFLAIALELAWGWHNGRMTYRVNDAIGSLFMGSLSTASKLVFIGAAGVVYSAVERHYALWRMDAESVWTWLFAWFAYDLCYYWFHRISHERQLFWASHVSHHQSEDYNLSTALRQTSTSFLLSWVFFLPVFLLGVPAQVYVTVASANLIYQFWVHTEHVPKLGWLEWVFITASNHRVHHAQNDRYMDRNYGGVFIIWDRLFGTYQEELEEEPCIYGIRGPLRTFSPLWANLHIYVAMVRDACWTASWRDRLRVLSARTGWRPGDVVDAHPRTRTDLAHFEKFDPTVSGAVNCYALYQLLATLALGLWLMSSPPALWLQSCACVTMLLFTMVCTANWLDGQSMAWRLDLLRLGFLLPAAWLAWQAGFGAAFTSVVVVYGGVNLLWLLFLRAGSDAAGLLSQPG